MATTEEILDEGRVSAIADEILAIQRQLTGIAENPRSPEQVPALLGTALGLRTRQAELGLDLALAVKTLLA